MADPEVIFREAFFRWVAELVRTTDLEADSNALFAKLCERIPVAMRQHIGTALINEWLVPDPRPNRGYRVVDPMDEDHGARIYLVTNGGERRVVPCWESYIQLADFSRLRALAGPLGLRVRLEDQLKDIAVWAGPELLLYVENKQTKSQAVSLLAKMRQYGQAGFEFDDLDVGNDALRKCKYLFSCGARPKFFGLSAVGHEQVFLIEYANERNRFALLEYSGFIGAPLTSVGGIVAPPTGIAPLSVTHSDSPASVPRPVRERRAKSDSTRAPSSDANFILGTPARSIADPFVHELQQSAGDAIWLSPGTGQTAVNVYFVHAARKTIALGIYKSGSMWTDLRALGPARAERLARELQAIGLSMTSPTVPWIKRGGVNANLAQEDPVALARAIASIADGEPGGNGPPREADGAAKNDADSVD